MVGQKPFSGMNAEVLYDDGEKKSMAENRHSNFGESPGGSVNYRLQV